MTVLIWWITQGRPHLPGMPRGSPPQRFLPRESAHSREALHLCKPFSPGWRTGSACAVLWMQTAKGSKTSLLRIFYHPFHSQPGRELSQFLTVEPEMKSRHTSASRAPLNGPFIYYKNNPGSHLPVFNWPCWRWIYIASDHPSKD